MILALLKRHPATENTKFWKFRLKNKMTIKILSDSLINQIAAGEVVERPASVVKELVENALDAGADQIVVDVVDGGRTLISVIDNGGGMGHEDLAKCIMRHATSKLADGDLLNINFMGFRGEALPSIASVSDMTIDTNRGGNGLQLNCSTGEIRPSAWESGTRVRAENLFGKTPARLKFLRSDRAEMMSIVEVVKRLALARPDVGFILNNKWRYLGGQSIYDRTVSIIGDDADGRMIEILNTSGELKLSGFVSEPTFRRASSIDQYLFVNGRPVKDKVLVGALRAAYMDVMSAREFPAVALYLELPSGEVDVNVSPAKTEVHFLEPSRIRAFIIKTIRDSLAVPLCAAGKFETESLKVDQAVIRDDNLFCVPNVGHDLLFINEPGKYHNYVQNVAARYVAENSAPAADYPLGRAIGQIGNKYILSRNVGGLVIVDQHAAHERIVYEKLRARQINRQPLLTPIVIKLKSEEVAAVMEIADELVACGLKIDEFGDDAIAIYEKPADWDLDWTKVLRDVASEVRSSGHSSKLSEKLHLKLANHACHHSVRAGQTLDLNQMNALLRDIENTERAGQCNHGRPVYKMITIAEIDKWFERL